MAGKALDKTNYDYLLVVIVAALLVLGLLMVYSTTFALDRDQPTYYIVRQLTAAGIGIVVCLIIARLPYHSWRKLSIPIMAGSLLLLIVVLIIGELRFGAKLALLGGSFQPSEVAKLAVIVYVSDWLTSKGDKIRHVTYGLIPFAILIGLVAALIMAQPDLGTATLVVFTAIVMFFLAGADLVQLVIGVLVSGATLALVVTRMPHAQSRLAEFWTSVTDPVAKGGFQIQQGLIALGVGGIFGRGLGDSQRKLALLPLPHSDSIFAVIGEELGLIGCLIVIGLFSALAYRGFRIAVQAPDTFGMILGSGITCWLVSQALINVAVITASAPFTGITLPFISYGGSSMVSSLAAVGLLLSISKGTREEDVRVHANLDLGGRDRRARLPAVGRRSGAGRRRKSEDESDD